METGATPNLPAVVLSLLSKPCEIATPAVYLKNWGNRLIADWLKVEGLLAVTPHRGGGLRLAFFEARNLRARGIQEMELCLLQNATVKAFYQQLSRLFKGTSFHQDFSKQLSFLEDKDT